MLQAIQAWLQSGYTERGVATIQAALEFSVFSPPFPPSMGTDSAKAAEFKDFWRSGAPRIGDEGGRGWSRWAEGLFLGGQQVRAGSATPGPAGACLGRRAAAATGHQRGRGAGREGKRITEGGGGAWLKGGTRSREAVQWGGGCVGLASDPERGCETVVAAVDRTRK